MCVVSATIDHYHKIWPTHPYIPAIWPNPLTPVEPSPWTIKQEQIDTFVKEVTKARKQDIRDGLPDCEKPELLAWMQKLLDRFDVMERKVDDILNLPKKTKRTKKIV
jgi:hypothetical protein